ncbi:MAG: PBP1A family penicillin-binding protein, partial [Candidatus Saganbacteria bacterium]|nr:PBP1A family penicillin-binding protein [Candidatus Saganbacteria bacterium]
MKRLFEIIISLIGKGFQAVFHLLSLLPTERDKKALVIILIVLAAFSGFMVQMILLLPDVSTISTYMPAETTEIYSADGVLLAKLHLEENRTVVPLYEISPILEKAIIAMEDVDFYEHHGFSLKGIGRAFISNLTKRKVTQGGSTITQQLARSLFLTKEKTIRRKLAELLLATQIERHYTKDEIFELYLNQVYWGHNAYGIESAAYIYFGKHAIYLDLADAALLAGMIRGPELYSPYRNPEGAKIRRDLTLDKMAELGVISEGEALFAKMSPLGVLPERPQEKKYIAPYFTSYVIQQLTDKYGEDYVYNGGLRVYTTLDSSWQRVAENVVQNVVASEGWPYNFSQAALVAIDPRTGYIKAMVGGASFEASEFNRVTQAKRQPGSSFKPYVYTAAMELGISPGFVIDDSAVTFEVPADEWNPTGKWQPKNFDGKFRGGVTVRQALEQSLNIPSIKLLDMIGVQAAINTAKKMGIESPLKRNLALTLGVSEITLLEHTSAFGVFANSGVRVEPTAILRVETSDGDVIEKHAIREKR